MRRTIITASAVIAGLALVLGATPVATAYWAASAQASVALAPAIPSVLAVATPPAVAMSGASGTSYAAIDVTNTSALALTGASLTASVTNPTPGLSVTARAATTNTSTPCSGLSYSAAVQPITQLGALSVGGSVRYCVSLAYADATAVMNGTVVVVSATVSGTAGNWVSNSSTATVTAVVSGAPAPPAPTQLAEASCTPGDLFAVLSWDDADPSYLYQVKIGSADNPVTLYEPSDATGVASGWWLSPGDYGAVTQNGPFTVVIVRAGTNIGVAQATLEMQNGWPRCLS